MAKASPKYADRPHARIYQHWFKLPSWKALRPDARLLLVYMLADCRPSTNGHLEWSLSRVQAALSCSRTTASAALTDLEKNGWIKVCRTGTFAGNRAPSLYRLTGQPCESENLPPTEEFLRVENPPHVGRKKNRTSFNGNRAKSLLEPPQVPVETAKAAQADEATLPQIGGDACKTGRLSGAGAGEPKPLGALAMQLLGASAFCRIASPAGDGAAREAFASVAPPAHAPTSPRRAFPCSNDRRS